MENSSKSLTALPECPSEDTALETSIHAHGLKREWNFYAVLGLSSATLCTWEATSALFAASYTNGGPASVVYGFIVSAVGTLCITASMAEMASMSPIAGAQYHWTAEHSPPRGRAFISWMQGWVTLLGWQAAVASSSFLISTMIQGLVKFNSPDYQLERWHATLMMIALCGMACLMNTFGKKLLPLWETLAGFFHVLFFLIVAITLVSTSSKAPNKAVWGTLINKSGWSSDGVSFCLGFLTPAFALAGSDGVVHMSEEAYSPNENIPRAMIWSVVINSVAGFLYILAVLYAITDATKVLGTETGFPIIEVFYQATKNRAAATAMMSSVIIVFTMALFGFVASASRLTFAFARDRGLPFSSFFAHITPWNRCPTRAVLLCLLVTSLLSLINIGSTAAFNAFLSLSTMGVYFSYGIVILVYTVRRLRGQASHLQLGPWNMGRWGMPVNIVAVAFCVFLIVFLPFPTELPVTRQNMNYSSPILIAVMGFAFVYYFLIGRKRYNDPIVEMDSPEKASCGFGKEEVFIEKKR